MVPKFEDDYFRYTGKKWDTVAGIKNLLANHALRHLFYLRQAEASKGKLKAAFLRYILHRQKLKYGLEIIGGPNIGGGLYLGHAFNIGINPNAIIGKNFNIHKGATIGQDNRGKRKGTPVIGDSVWVGINSTIVGNIRIGNNVLIAPNTFVNFDVPDDTIVIGNPAKLIQRKDATEGYINNCV